jgi:hypothetical protein
VLPDDVLLEIFDFNMIMDPSYKAKTEVEGWQSLVHVCDDGETSFLDHHIA